jgi:tetratricopeptide (TPR) repeat protein
MFANQRQDRVKRSFQSPKECHPDALREAQLNTLGYKLLQQGRSDDAIAVFKLNVDAFPQSGNVYDSLGEAYLRKGDRPPRSPTTRKRWRSIRRTSGRWR